MDETYQKSFSDSQFIEIVPFPNVPSMVGQFIL